MSQDLDSRDKREARKLALVLVVLLVLLCLAALLLLPTLLGFADQHLAPGLGLRDAALLSFFATVLLMLLFALVAGDGFLGEIQFMLASFFGFFLVIWLLLAWMF